MPMIVAFELKRGTKRSFFAVEDASASTTAAASARKHTGRTFTSLNAKEQAQEFAFEKTQERIRIHATEKLVTRLAHMHPEPKREEAFYLRQIGLMYESLASRLLHKKEKESAEKLLEKALSFFQMAAAKMHCFHPSTSMKFGYYSEVGMAWKMLDKPEMAKRAYFWALTDPLHFQIDSA